MKILNKIILSSIILVLFFFGLFVVGVGLKTLCHCDFDAGTYIVMYIPILLGFFLLLWGYHKKIIGAIIYNSIAIVFFIFTGLLIWAGYDYDYEYIQVLWGAGLVLSLLYIKFGRFAKITSIILIILTIISCVFLFQKHKEVACMEKCDSDYEKNDFRDFEEYDNCYNKCEKILF